MAIVPGPAMTRAPPLNSIIVRPLDPPLVRTLGLVQRKGRAETPAFKLVREAILALGSEDTEIPPRAPQRRAAAVASR
jgi:hypothetical protein